MEQGSFHWGTTKTSSFSFGAQGVHPENFAAYISFSRTPWNNIVNCCHFWFHTINKEHKGHQLKGLFNTWMDQLPLFSTSSKKVVRPIMYFKASSQSGIYIVFHVPKNQLPSFSRRDLLLASRSPLNDFHQAIQWYFFIRNFYSVRQQAMNLQKARHISRYWKEDLLRSWERLLLG